MSIVGKPVPIFRIHINKIQFYTLVVRFLLSITSYPGKHLITYDVSPSQIGNRVLPA